MGCHPQQLERPRMNPFIPWNVVMHSSGFANSGYRRKGLPKFPVRADFLTEPGTCSHSWHSKDLWDGKGLYAARVLRCGKLLDQAPPLNTPWLKPHCTGSCTPGYG